MRSTALAGPYVAFSGDGQFGDFRVDALVSQAVLFGDVDYRVRTQSQFSTSTGFQPPHISDTYSDRPLDRKSRKAEVPVTELRLKVAYDVTDYLSIGAGGYAGVWWDVERPGLLTPGDGANGDLDEETLVFLGIMATVDLRFSGP
ncbi:MAG: hypothetical protein JRG83_10720 [Deltaproteobacteria bacterium]|nr:hypothetical protein [Deltaproteobacteria bacterium]